MVCPPHHVHVQVRSMNENRLEDLVHKLCTGPPPAAYFKNM